ncbi:MAG: hypothetical protein VYA67_21765 [Actinomycetota bacterium]|nr:hypothetical protein [Actinomycetota bacterium]
MSNEVARQGSSTNRYVRHWAILMPNGELYAQAIQVPDTSEPVEDYSVPSPQRDMSWMGLLGMGMTPQRTKTVWEPVIFADRASAEKVLADITKQAARLGVIHWGGMVVERICTPFVAADPAVQFSDDIITWIQKQQGEQSS